MARLTIINNNSGPNLGCRDFRSEKGVRKAPFKSRGTDGISVLAGGPGKTIYKVAGTMWRIISPMMMLQTGMKPGRAKRVKQGPDLVEIETLESQAFYLDQSSTLPSATWSLLK